MGLSPATGDGMSGLRRWFVETYDRTISDFAEEPTPEGASGPRPTEEHRKGSPISTAVAPSAGVTIIGYVASGGRGEAGGEWRRSHSTGCYR